jgi:tetratricopeptide (TPR) repeat protein
MQRTILNMQHRRSSPVFAYLCLITLATLFVSSLSFAQSASPRPPATRSRAEIIDLRIREEQARVARDPTYWDSYDRLASAYAQKARETGDISYFQLAEAALDQSLKLESTHREAAPAYTQLATVHLAEHRFREAGEDAEKAIALTPDNLIAYPYAGDAELEIGNYQEAHAFYAHLIAPNDDRPHPELNFLLASHGAGLDWIEGRIPQATDDLTRAIELAREIHLPAENVAWTEFMLGEQFFLAGDLAAAEKYETASLIDFPRYHRALAAMGQVRAAQGRYPEAIDFYRRAIAIIPLPLYVAALADIYTANNDPADAKKQFALVEYIGKLSAINQQVFNRELALFYADHDIELPTALTLAEKELEVRHDVYTSDALAWAYLKNNSLPDARTNSERALRLGTQDAMMQYHAGMIYLALGDRAKTIAHLQRALAINPHFHVLFAPQAVKTLASLELHPAPPSTGATPTK